MVHISDGMIAAGRDAYLHYIGQGGYGPTDELLKAIYEAMRKKNIDETLDELDGWMI